MTTATRTPTLVADEMQFAMLNGADAYTRLSARGQHIVRNTSQPVVLASIGRNYVDDSKHHDPTRWPAAWVDPRALLGPCCVGGFMAVTAGFTPGRADTHTIDGDNWWDVCAALIGDHLIADGLSLFAPEAHPDAIRATLDLIIEHRPLRLT